jgi:RhtB (resistance to homoserine/threonine) family protein
VSSPCEHAYVVLLAFIGVSLVVICTPGPDTVLTIRNTLAGGRRGGVFTAAGVSAGQLTWTVASALGLAALLQASQAVFGWLKLAGAAYLIYLGVRSLISAWRRQQFIASELQAPRRLRGSAALRQGLISNLANPKMIAFFLSVLPQFVSVDRDPLVGFLALGAVFCLLTFAWLSLYAVALDRGRALLNRPAVRKAMDTIAGAALVVLGLRLASQTNRM